LEHLFRNSLPKGLSLPAQAAAFVKLSAVNSANISEILTE
jgi:hypothetical protein